MKRPIFYKLLRRLDNVIAISTIPPSFRTNLVVVTMKEKFSLHHFCRQSCFSPIHFLDHHQRRMEDPSFSKNVTQIQQPATEAAIPCTVCGCPSRGFIYGAIACDPCKKFFRRNAQRGLVKFKQIPSARFIFHSF